MVIRVLRKIFSFVTGHQKHILVCIIILGFKHFLFAQTIIPLQGLIAHHQIDYYLHFPSYEIFFGDLASSQVILRLQDGTTYFLSGLGRFFTISSDGTALIFEKGKVTISADTIEITPGKESIPGIPINRFALCYQLKNGNYQRLGKPIQLDKTVREFIKKESPKLIDVLPKRIFYLQDNRLKIFNGQTNQDVELPKGGHIVGIWSKNDSLKLLLSKKVLLSEAVERQLLTFRFKPTFHQTGVEESDFLSARDGVLQTEPEETIAPGGMFPVSDSTVYLSLSKGIYRLMKKERFWVLKPFLQVGGYLSYILPLSDSWLAAEVYPDSIPTYRVTGLSRKPIWHREQEPLYFVEVYDSTFLYQQGNVLGMGTPGGPLYRTTLPAESRVTHFQNSMMTLTSPRGVELLQLKIVQGKLVTTPMYRFQDTTISWIIPLKRLPLPVKKGWELNCSNPEYTFKEAVGTTGAFRNPINWVMALGNTLFVGRQNYDLCIVPLLKEGKTQLPYKIYALKYGYGYLWLFTGRGLERYPPGALPGDAN